MPVQSAVGILVKDDSVLTQKKYVYRLGHSQSLAFNEELLQTKQSYSVLPSLFRHVLERCAFVQSVDYPCDTSNCARLVSSLHCFAIYE